LKYPEFCKQGLKLFVDVIKPWYAHHKDIMAAIDKEFKKIDEEHETHVKKMKDADSEWLTLTHPATKTNANEVMLNDVLD
jgi:hypothetical protein